MRIRDSIRQLPPRERAAIKSREIEKMEHRGRFATDNGEIEIQELREVDGHIEAFVRAWDTEGNTVGFGRDGKVEIERIRIINPPILVDDPSGEIVKRWTDQVTGLERERRLREDPAKAMRDVIADAVRLVGKSGERVRKGKVGRTTTVVYAGAGDGDVLYGGVNNWDTTHDSAAGTTALPSGTQGYFAATQYFAPAPQWRIDRGFLPFDTSGIPASDTIDSAVVSVYQNSTVPHQVNDAYSFVGVVQTRQADETTLGTGDYDECGESAANGWSDAFRSDIIEGATRVDLDTMSTGYIDFTLTSTGLGWIARSGETKPTGAAEAGFTFLGFREGHDLLDQAYPSGSSQLDGLNDVTYSEETGTTKDPKITIEHTASAIETDDERSAEAYGIDTANASRDAEAHGSDSAASERDAEAYGQEQAPASREAEAHGVDQTDDERSAEAHGTDTAENERAAEASGAVIATASRDAEAHGIDQEISERSAEADGGIFVNSERSAEASGTDSDDDQRAAEATGAFIADATRSAEAHGVDSETTDREAEATGADSESSDRAAEATAQAARIDSPVMRKSISIKAYTRAGTFIREIADADFSGFMKVINQGLGDCIITIGRKFDDIGADFVEGNHIEIWLTDKETVAMQFGPLRSRRIYAGEVKLVEPMIEGAQEQVQITLQGYGILLGLDVLKSTAQTSLYTRTTGGVGTTDTPQAVDIGSVVRGIIDRYIAETVNPRIGYTAASIPAVGEDMTYTFEQRTYREAIEKCLATAPFGHYWYLDENGLFSFKQIGATPTHKFVFGKHFSGVRVARSLEKVRNFMMIWNGLPTGGGGLYKKYENAASVLKYGRRVERLTDAGIGSEATMDLIGAKFLAESSEIEVKFIFTVMDNQGSDAFGYDIESINPGDTCTVFNFNSSISELLRENMIITEVEYTPQRARITIEPIRISIADISERLKKQISEQATQGIIESYS